VLESYVILGDTNGAGSEAEEACRARVKSVWAKFRELAAVGLLISRGEFLKVKGKVC